MDSQKSNVIKTDKEHFIQLEWLRFFLGIYIILYHTFHYNGMPDWVRKSTEMGFYATSTFFVLSGFLLAHVYLKNHTSPDVSMREPAKSFLIKRFSNLYPIHIGSLIITLIFVSLLPVLLIIPSDINASIRYVMYDVNNHTPAELLNHYMSNGEMIIAFVMNFLLLHAWNPYYLTFNAPAWSISTLFFLYLLFPYIAPRLHKIKKPLLAIIIINLLYLVPVIYVVSTSQFGMPETGILHRNPLIRLPEFAAGILLCSLYHKRKELGKKLSCFGIISLSVFIMGCMYGASVFLTNAPLFSSKGNLPYYFLHDGALLLSQLALIYVFLSIPLPNNEKFNKFSQKLGTCSLPMFALHVPLYMVFLRAQKLLTGDPVLCFENFRQCVAAAGPKDVVYYPLFLILTVLFCIVFQEQFVVRFRKLIQKHLLPKHKTKET